MELKKRISCDVIILRGKSWRTLIFLLSELVAEELKLGTGCPSAHMNTPTHAA